MAKRRVLRPKKKVKKSQSNKKVILFLGLGFLFIILFLIYFFQVKEIQIRKKKNEFLKSIPSGFSSVGIDISHHQGEMDWKKLFRKNAFDTLIHFVYCKASEGITHVDREWKKNRVWLLKNNKNHGAYHFFLPDEDPLLQAKHFLSLWKKQDGDLPPVLDIEIEAKDLKVLYKNMTVWLNEVEKISGMRPIIYTSLNFYEEKFHSTFMNYKFWIAAYSRKPDCINDDRILHWQFTENGIIPGTKEKVDINVSKIDFK
ncbi:MAG: glycoside hydrolase family 25 protein [Flavobacteriia bacterium]|nr:glycoside hydrolase family 25 protein [Flavobacteriia bacterium]